MLRIALGLVLVLTSVVLTGGAEASCGNSRTITSDSSGIWHDEWDIHGVSVYGTYSFTKPPITPNLDGFFWALGSGDPALGAGIDSGSLTISDWTQFYFYSGPSLPFYARQAVMDTDWSATGVDGCIDQAGAGPALEGDECVAVVLTDLLDNSPSPEQDNSRMAIWTGQVDSMGNASMEQPGAAPIVLQEITRALVTHTQAVVPNRVRVFTGPQPLPVGTYMDPSCPDPVVGYRVYYVLLPRNTGPFPSLELGPEWTLVTEGAGPGGLRDLADSAEYLIACAFSQDLHIAHQLVFESGFEAPFLGERLPRITCGDHCVNADVDVHCENQDCDDTNADIYPGAPELCDGLNNDCDDASWPTPAATEVDQDNDGFFPCQGDCNDGNASIRPGQAEACNGVDDDCDGLTDEDPLGLDTDLDSVGDSCDNCVNVADTSQADRDLDLVGDVCDLDDGELFAWFDSGGDLGWQDESGFGLWNVYRGDLAVLLGGGAYTQATGSNPSAARFCGVAAPSLADGMTPATGTVAFYLVTGKLMGIEIDLGETGAGAVRPNTAPCP